MTTIGSRPRAALLALHILVLGAFAAPVPAAAMQILDAADHAELAAEISATNVNRIALAGDRIARVARAPDGYAVEHDARSGDLYLRASAPASPGDTADGPVTLFIGTEKGFTYRLTLRPAARDSAQILIRNAGAAPAAAAANMAGSGGPRIAALVDLVRAVAGRALLPGYAVESGDRRSVAGLTLVETWRGPRIAALVFEAERPASQDADGLAGLAGTIERMLGMGRVAALWLAPAPDSDPGAAGTGPSGGRLAVAVTETVPAGDTRAGAPR